MSRPVNPFDRRGDDLDVLERRRRRPRGPFDDTPVNGPAQNYAVWDLPGARFVVHVEIRTNQLDPAVQAYLEDKYAGGQQHPLAQADTTFKLARLGSGLGMTATIRDL